MQRRSLYPLFTSDVLAQNSPYNIQLYPPQALNNQVIDGTANLEETLKQWPKKAELAAPDEEYATALRKFVRDTETRVDYVVNEDTDKNILTVQHKSALATQISFTLEEGFIDVETHNGSSSQAFLVTLGYALPAIKKLYEAFSLPNFIPEMRFDANNALWFHAPFSNSQTTMQRQEFSEDQQRVYNAFIDASITNNYQERYELRDNMHVEFSQEEDRITGEIIIVMDPPIYIQDLHRTALQCTRTAQTARELIIGERNS